MDKPETREIRRKRGVTDHDTCHGPRVSEEPTLVKPLASFFSLLLIAFERKETLRARRAACAERFHSMYFERKVFGTIIETVEVK